jgi:drug/metabolite transporter (DMT)-like permease
MLASEASSQQAHAEHRRGQALVALAAIAWSTAGLFQRELSLDVPTQMGGRALFAFLSLAAFAAVAERGRVRQAFVAIGRAGLVVAVCMATASGGFIVALNHTSVARVLFVQAVSPVAAALLAWIALGERVAPRGWVAMAGALAGVGVMMGSPGGSDLTGDVASLVMMVGFAIAIVVTRHRRDVSMLPATCLAQAILVVTMAPISTPGDVGGDDLVLLVAIGAIQMALGMGLFAAGARLVPAAEAALITLLEVILGPIWVWLVLSERPDTATLVGGAIIMLAVVVQVSGDPRGQAEVEAEIGTP